MAAIKLNRNLFCFMILLLSNIKKMISPSAIAGDGCSNSSAAVLPPGPGLVSSHVLGAGSEGLPGCPWQVSGRRGQQVDLYLMDFTLSNFIAQNNEGIVPRWMH